MKSACDQGNWHAVISLITSAIQSGNCCCPSTRDYNVKHKDLRELFENPEYKQRALMRAVKSRAMPVVHCLVSKKTSLDYRDKKGKSYLIAAATKGYADVVKYLLEQTSEYPSDATTGSLLIDAQNNKGKTALFCAAQEGFDDIISRLCNSSANLNVSSCTGTTALMKAAENGHLACVRNLIAFGADLNIVDTDQNTALLWACRGCHKEVAVLLVESGAEVDIENCMGRTALFYAAQRSFDQDLRVRTIYII
jgi:ankyrin repeat protein